MPLIEINSFVNIISVLQLDCKPFETGIMPYEPLFKRVRFKLLHIYYSFGKVKLILIFIFI